MRAIDITRRQARVKRATQPKAAQENVRTVALLLSSLKEGEGLFYEDIAAQLQITDSAARGRVEKLRRAIVSTPYMLESVRVGYRTKFRVVAKPGGGDS